MRRSLFALLLPAGAWVFGGGAAAAETVALTPSADAFVAAAQPNSNYGGAGALSVAAPPLAQGAFASILRFDTSAAVAQLNSIFGAGNWTIESVTLRLTATAPNNPLFNPAHAGLFNATWMQNDSWVEGTGNPSNPTTNGITFATLPSFLLPGDEAIGTNAFTGGTSGAAVYALTPGPGFLSDLSGGGLVSLLLDTAPNAETSYLFNSRSIGNVDARPTLSITAVPEPSALAMLAILIGLGCRRFVR